MNTNNNETNTNTTPDAVDAINPSTHGGLTAADIAEAEGITNNAPIVARIRKGEIATGVKVVADGWGAAFKYLGAFDRTPKWFPDGVSRFAFRSGDTRARRLTGEGEDGKGHCTIINYVPTVRITRTENGQKVTEWYETAHLLSNVGVCVPSRVNLALAKKIQSVFNRIFCSGHSPADVLGKKMSDKERAAKATEEAAYWRAEAERLAKVAAEKSEK